MSKLFLFLTILLAPLYVVRFEVGRYPSTLLEVLIGLTVVSWIVERFRKTGLKGIKARPPASSLAGEVGRGINTPTVLFLAAGAISVFVSPDKRGALGIFKAYFVEPILIYLVIKNIVKSKKDWRLVFSALVFSGLWVALLAVFQGLTGQFTFASHEAALGRAHAVYNTANAVGLYLGPIVFLVLGSLGRFRGFWKREGRLFYCFIVLLLVLMVAAILFSKSTGAMVGLVGGLGVLGILKKKWLNGQVAKLLGAAAVLAGILFFFNISNFTPENVDPYVRESTNTLQFRLCLWEGTKNLLLDRPIFGAGLSGFKELYSQQYFTCDAEPLEYPHNWVLNFWTETGLLGLVAFLWILWRYFKNVNGYMATRLHGREEVAKKPSSHLAMQPFFLAAMVYWLIHGLVDVPYFKNDLALEFWVIVGLVDTLRYYERGS